MPGPVLLVRCVTKENARPVIAMRMVSQRVGCMRKMEEGSTDPMNNPGAPSERQVLAQDIAAPPKLFPTDIADEA
jgi:hypothetical protein